jgi:hypothetical protein
MPRPGRKLTYRVTAWNEKSQYWAIIVDGHEEWGEATAWRTSQVEERAVELIAKHTGKPAEQINVIVRHRIGGRH